MSCNCGSSCGCGSDCKCGKMYPDIEVEKATSSTIIEGVAPTKMSIEGSETSFAAEGGHACTCGDSCKCSPCTC